MSDLDKDDNQEQMQPLFDDKDDKSSLEKPKAKKTKREATQKQLEALEKARSAKLSKSKPPTQKQINELLENAEEQKKVKDYLKDKYDIDFERAKREEDKIMDRVRRKTYKNEKEILKDLEIQAKEKEEAKPKPKRAPRKKKTKVIEYVEEESSDEEIIERRVVRKKKNKPNNEVIETYEDNYEPVAVSQPAPVMTRLKRL